MAERELFADGIRLSERQFEELIPNTGVSGGDNNESDSDDDATEQIARCNLPGRSRRTEWSNHQLLVDFMIAFNLLLMRRKNHEPIHQLIGLSINSFIFCPSAYCSYIRHPLRLSGGKGLGSREKLLEEVGRREKMAKKVERWEIYRPVPPPYK